MNLRKKIKTYLEYCQFRKELNLKTIAAYEIDLKLQAKDREKENGERQGVLRVSGRGGNHFRQPVPQNPRPLQGNSSSPAYHPAQGNRNAS